MYWQPVAVSSRGYFSYHLTSNNGLYSTGSSTSEPCALVPVLVYESGTRSHANLCACKMVTSGESDRHLYRCHWWSKLPLLMKLDRPRLVLVMYYPACTIIPCSGLLLWSIQLWSGTLCTLNFWVFLGRVHFRTKELAGKIPKHHIKVCQHIEK